MPFQILGMWLRPLLAFILLGVGITLVVHWAQHQDSAVSLRPSSTRLSEPDESSDHREPSTKPSNEVIAEQRHVRRRQVGLNSETVALAAGVALILWTFAGGWVLSVAFLRRDKEPPEAVGGGIITRLARPDGSELHVEVFGNPQGTPVILTHGWGLDSQEWTYARIELAKRCKIIVWDLPGLGRSKAPSNNDFSLENLAHDLEAVMELAGANRVILVGHSIGGMIILTYCRLFQHNISARVAGIVLGQTTYTNPVETTSMAAFYRAIQKPVLEPLCHLMIAMAPVMWLMNWWSYVTGSIHRTNHKSFFSGTESREQLSFISRYAVQAWPAVVARGFLAMFRYDATPILSSISVPTIVVGGDRDVTCKHDASVRMSETIREASLVTLATARHGGVFEFHQPFAEAVHRLISTSTDAPSSLQDGSPAVLASGRHTTIQ